MEDCVRNLAATARLKILTPTQQRLRGSSLGTEAFWKLPTSQPSRAGERKVLNDLAMNGPLPCLLFLGVDFQLTLFHHCAIFQPESLNRAAAVVFSPSLRQKT